MTNVPVGPVLEHIAMLKMSDADLAEKTGIPIRTFQELKTVRKRVRPETAEKIFAVRIDHVTTIDPNNRVLCTCGFSSQRFGTVGMAKAQKRMHESGDSRTDRARSVESVAAGGVLVHGKLMDDVLIELNRLKQSGEDRYPALLELHTKIRASGRG